MDAFCLFRERLDEVLCPLLDKNIIIYGCNQGGDFVRWYLKYFYSKDIKTFVDRWAFSPINTIPHLWSFYYLYDKNDVILNVTPNNISDEFNDTGEQWEFTNYKKNQIIDLWFMFYGDYRYGSSYPDVTFYKWLEIQYHLDITKTVRRQFISGDGHGYFPTDFRMIYEGIKRYHINFEEDSILDIGSGKGSAVFSLISSGFKKVGAVEYTDSIYDILKSNLERMGIWFEERELDKTGNIDILEKSVICYKGDAALMTEALDEYNWFFMFNPFPREILEKVIENICESRRRNPRICHIFYVEPIGHQYILDTGFFVQSECIKADYSDTSYYAYIYDSKEI